MKKIMCIVLMLAMAPLITASIVLEDFESYSDDAALAAAWVPQTSNVLGVSLETINGSTGMLFHVGQIADNPGWSQVMFDVPGAVWGSYGVDFTAGGFTALTLDVTVPANTPETYGGSGGIVYLSLIDCWGQTVFSTDIASNGYATPSGTGPLTWKADFATFTKPGMNLDNVAKISAGFSNTYFGEGGVYFDNITLVPEPTTIVMLGFGAIFLLRRKRA